MHNAHFGKSRRLALSLIILLAGSAWCTVSLASWRWHDHVTISGTPATSVTAGQAYAFTPSATDSEGRALVFAIANKPPWATFTASSGQLSGTPPAASVGTYSNIVIAVSDGLRTATLPAFAVQVLAGSGGSPPPPPTISGTPASSDVAGSAYSFQPTASGPSGTTLSFSVQNLPSWASFSVASGRLSGTPSSTQSGTYGNIIISVSDGKASASLPAFSIQVTTASVANPAVTLTASPGTVTSGSASTLNWSSTNATSCMASGNWSGSMGVSGSKGTGALSNTATYTLTCSGASGTTPAAQTAKVAVVTSGSLAISSPATLPNATNGGGYFYFMQASGGSPPYSWSLSSHTGSTGWVTTSDGWIEGAPTTNETDSLVIKVTDSANNSVQGTYSLTVNANLAVMNQNFVAGGVSLPPSIAGNAYSHTLQAAGGASNYLWSIVSGALPAGLSLSSAGAITGTPSGSGSFSGIVFKVSDSAGNSATASASIQVGAANKASRPSNNTGTGLFVSNGRLYDPSGNEFRIRGVDRDHYDSNSSGLAASGVNAVRIFVETNYGASVAALVNIVQTQHIDQKEVPIVTSPYTSSGGITSCDTSNATLNSVVASWVAAAPSWTPLNHSMIVNIANEWGPSNSSAWATAYEGAIAQMRAAGYLGTLLIDTGGCGQDEADLTNYAAQVLAADPQKNVIFAYHLYGGTSNYQAPIASASGQVITLTSTSPTHPFQPSFNGSNNSWTPVSQVVIQSPSGTLTTVPISQNLGGHPGAWTVTATGSLPAIAAGSTLYDWANYQMRIPRLAALRSQGVIVAITEFGPGQNLYPSPTMVTPGQVIATAEANGLGWAPWAWDAGSAYTISNTGDYTAPSNLTGYGLDVTLNPAYGWKSLASPASSFLSN
jgi:hypothetical protein